MHLTRWVCIFLSHSDERRQGAHLVISMATGVYLMLPPKGRLVPGHCAIVPAGALPGASHSSSMLALKGIALNIAPNTRNVFSFLSFAFKR